MKSLVALFSLLVVFTLVGACSGWQVTSHKTLDGMFKIGEMAHVELNRDVCRPAINKCKDMRVTLPHDPCTELKECQEARRLGVKTLTALQHAILNGLMAVQLADKPSTEKAVATGLSLLGSVREALLVWGVKL